MVVLMKSIVQKMVSAIPVPLGLLSKKAGA